MVALLVLALLAVVLIWKGPRPTSNIVQQKLRGPPSGAALLLQKTWRLR